MLLDNLNNDALLQIGISLGLIALAIVLGRVLTGLILGRLLKNVGRHTPFAPLVGFVSDALRTTVYWVVVAVVTQLAVLRLDLWTAAWRDNIGNIFFGIYFILAFAFVWRLVVQFFAWLRGYASESDELELDESIIPFIRQVTLVVISLIGLIALLGFFGIDAGGLVATLGVGSLAVALAAQEALSDAFGGVMINLDRPFKVGDRIDIQEVGALGDVLNIGIRSTRLKTLDHREIIIPNSVISKNTIVNLAAPDEFYRLDIPVGVAYGSDVAQVKQVVADAVRSTGGVLETEMRPLQIDFVEMADSALVFTVKAWLPHFRDREPMIDRLNTAIYAALNEAGIEIPFPQRDTHIKLSSDTIEVLKEVFGRATE